MSRWRSYPHKTILVVGLLFGLAALPTVSGCDQNGSFPFSRVIQVVGDLRPLPEETEVEVQRFARALAEKMGTNQISEETLEYFRFALRRIRSSYVVPVNESELIDSAIDALTKTSVTPKIDTNDLVEVSLDAMTKSLTPIQPF